MKTANSVLNKANTANNAGQTLVKTGNAANALVEHVETGSKFRQQFEIHSAKLNFHPGHMSKGMRKMQSRLAKVDCILEVHDARIPFSGRNSTFYNKLTAVRPHILVLNKSDLVGHEEREEIREILFRNEPHLADVIYTNSKKQFDGSIKSIMPKVVTAIDRCAMHSLKRERHFMLIGVPNTGKSSMVNAMRFGYARKGKANKVENMPGTTRAMQERVKLSDNPPTYVWDTPGVTEPSLPDVETGMRLAAVGCYKDHDVGLDNIADYILYFMNKREMFHYVNAFGMEEPTDDVYVLLVKVAQFLNFTIRSMDLSSNRCHRIRYDTIKAAEYFLHQFRIGNLGTFLLDDDRLAEERAKHSTLRLSSRDHPLAIGSRNEPLALESNQSRMSLKW